MSAPKGPAWAWWAVRKLLPPTEVRAVENELRELHEHWSRHHGERAADRRYRRQVAQYPFRLLVGQRGGIPVALGELASIRNSIQALRSLARVPALSASVVLTVGVGLGGCSAIFAVVNALFLEPLPYPESEQLTWIYTDSPPNRWPFSVADYQALVEQQSSFEAVAAYSSGTMTVTTPEIADRVRVARVTSGYFDLMGIDLIAGRAALDADAAVGAEPTVVVTLGFAGRYAGATDVASDAVGDVVRLDGVSYRVVGVVPDQHGPLGPTVVAFPTLQLQPPGRRGPFFLTVFGRLATEPEAAASELRALNDRLFPVWADSYQDQSASWGMTSLEELLVGDTQRLVVALMGSVAMLLLMGSANAANLLLARIGRRKREMAVRLALGASRGRVVGYLLVESAVLAIGGMIVGLGLAWGAIEILPSIAAGYIPRLDEVGLNGRVVGFAGVLALATGVLFGLVTALGPDTTDLAGQLRASGRSSTAGAKQQRAQRFLVVGQLAIAVPLLAGAALLASSFMRLASVDVGFVAEGHVSVRVPLAGGSYPDNASRRAFWDEATARLTALPGVRAVGVGSGRPPDQVGMINNFDLEDRPTPEGISEPNVPWPIVDNGYFEALGVSLLEGRLFTPEDLEDGAPVVVVDRAWADRFFPGEEALGRRLVSGGCTSCPLTTVVGVVGSVPYLGVGRIDEGAVYGPGGREYLASPVLHLRTTGESADVIAAVRAELRALDPTIPLTDFATGEDLLATSLTQPRHLSLLLGAFSFVAMLLAVVGLYGILAYSVQQRRGDIAVRLALGGAPSTVLAMVVRQGMTLVVLGIAVGTGVAIAFTRVLSDLLYDVEPTDPVSLLGACVLLLVVSMVACGIPARRAVRVDPAHALNAE